MISKKSTPIALVTGATGTVGPALVAQLLKAGYHVRTLHRQRPLTEMLPAQVEVHQGNVTSAQDVAAAMTDCTLIFHLAAKLHINNPSERLRAEYERVNVKGTEIVTQAAQQAQVRRLIFFSTINVYATTSFSHARQPTLLTETGVVGPETLYGMSKLQAETIALSAKRVDGQPLTTVLRLAAVYGPHMRGNYLRLWQMVRQGFYPRIGDGQNRRSLIYEQDVAQAALLAATAERAAGQIYNLTDGKIYTLTEIVEAMAHAHSRTVYPIPLPLTLARHGARLLSLAWSLRGRSAPLGVWTVDKLVEDIAISGTKVQQELGFMPHYTLADGWKEMVT